tara:strand:+ start:7264 stop:7512 length:249 start_codon:yes stop_codon:yes gene_type:complete
MRSEALKKAQKKYYEKVKNTEEYKSSINKSIKKYYDRIKHEEGYLEKRREYSKNYYNKNRNKILLKRKEEYAQKKLLKITTS